MSELKPTKLDKIPVRYFYSFFSGEALNNEEKNFHNLSHDNSLAGKIS